MNEYGRKVKSWLNESRIDLERVINHMKEAGDTKGAKRIEKIKEEVEEEIKPFEEEQ